MWRIWVQSRASSWLLLGAVLLAAAPTVVLAQGVCVVCSAPEAVYRCQAESAAVRPGDSRLGLLCITEIARTGGHESCSVSRQVARCDGALLRTVVLAPSPEEPPPRLQAETAPAAAEPKEKQGPPETVADLAKRTAAQSKEQLEKATGVVSDVARKTGGAVTSAAEKSWRCLSSFFQNC